MHIICVVGTSTGIGKTTIASALVARIASMGYRVSGFKPIETGCLLSDDSDLPIPGLPHVDEADRTTDDRQAALKARQAIKRLQALTGSSSTAMNLDAPSSHLIPTDATILHKMTNIDIALDEINPFRYAAPVAPSVAARLAGRPVAVKDVLEKMTVFESRVDYLIIEGAGGLLVPINERELMVDYMVATADWVSRASNGAHSFTSLLVGASSLGTINHCLLTAEALATRRLSCCGIVLNRLEKELKPEEASNPDQIEAFCRDHRAQSCPVLGVFPYLDDIVRGDADQLANKINVHVDLAPVLAI